MKTENNQVLNSKEPTVTLQSNAKLTNTPVRKGGLWIWLGIVASVVVGGYIVYTNQSKGVPQPSPFPSIFHPSPTVFVNKSEFDLLGITKSYTLTLPEEFQLQFREANANHVGETFTHLKRNKEREWITISEKPENFSFIVDIYPLKAPENEITPYNTIQSFPEQERYIGNKKELFKAIGTIVNLPMINGIQGFEVEKVPPPMWQGEGFYIREVFLLKDNSIYEISVNAISKDIFEAHRKTFYQILSTFRFVERKRKLVGSQVEELKQNLVNVFSGNIAYTQKIDSVPYFSKSLEMTIEGVSIHFALDSYKYHRGASYETGYENGRWRVDLDEEVNQFLKLQPGKQTIAIYGTGGKYPRTVEYKQIGKIWFGIFDESFAPAGTKGKQYYTYDSIHNQLIKISFVFYHYGSRPTTDEQKDFLEDFERLLTYHTP